ncbi:4-alpha-glucanotransferase [Photobacterium rosenbergii]|uniref:4-alpha-glucanotransferase n=1 Tax=Photobacterium rosenbergii TaxID=294936 RepID=A0A2T3NDE8_9GAMM|nr:4-alpha-glucanotransferase [Photobacterium rosenbergii]PSW12261.1 4-alpha-glucanotransferase [Photobacterium rosenbergii]
MIEKTVLNQVAAQAGIADSYTNAWGEQEKAQETIVTRVLQGLGYQTTTDEEMKASAAEVHSCKGLIEPVIFAKENHPIHVDLYIGRSIRPADFNWEIISESGQTIRGEIKQHVISDQRDADGPLTVSLPYTMEMGYHRFFLHRKRKKTPYEADLIVTPKSCYKQPAMLAGHKSWGTSVQLYCLKSHHNWGVGDFGDLKLLIAKIAEQGGDFVGLNPIHSLYPAQPDAASPYSPSSRRWLNIIYLDVPSIPEFAFCAGAQEKVGDLAFQSRLKAMRDNEWIDYTGVTEAKLEVLAMLYQEFCTRHEANQTDYAKAFEAFVEEGGDSLLKQAAFDALHAELKKEDETVWGWPVFPQQYRHFSKRAVQSFIADNQELVRFYMYLQWNAEIQLQEAQQLAHEKGMMIGLYRDLAVGVSEGGVDAWASEGELTLDLSIGAPPDVLGPQGQNWGLLPLNPSMLKQQAYRPFIELLRANMRHCGALRIDHVLGLLRLWLIPKGEGASNGVYVNYPVEQLLGLLSLESHRHQCAVIGEDLGTVPDEIVGLLQEAGVHSYKVFFFEAAEDGGFYSPAHYPVQSMATLCTHDMPTLRGFWHCEDLKMGKELGLYPDEEQLQTLYDSRLHDKQQIINSMDGHGMLPPGLSRDARYLEMDRVLSHSMQCHLAAGSSSLLSLQLEDWLEMDLPVNIPGTVDEYPNWRRKLNCCIEDMMKRQDVLSLTQLITEARRSASKVA